MKTLNIILTIIFILCFTSACTTNLVETIQSKQDVLIESIPNGSDIYMDGEFMGTTPSVLNLRSDVSHEILLKKEGFKSTKSSLNPISKYEKQPYVQFGPAKDLGYYYQLSSDHIMAELEWNALPSSVGITPFESMSGLIAKAENALSAGELSEEEHKIILSQIIEFFNSN